MIGWSASAPASRRQHDALDPICAKVFEEKVSGKLHADDRPGLTAAIDYLREGDMLTCRKSTGSAGTCSKG